MKKMLVVVMLGALLLGSMGAQAQAGDREWAVAGKVLTGLAVLSAITTPVVYEQPACYAPPVAYAPAPVVYAPPPVVYRPIVVRRPRVIYRPIIVRRPPRVIHHRPVHWRPSHRVHHAAYRPGHGGRRR